MRNVVFTLLLAAALAVIALAAARSEGRASPASRVFAGDVPIAWDDQQPGPSFWACLVAIPEFAADVTSVAPPGLRDTLTPMAGYGAGHVRVLANQGGAETAPTWANVASCIDFLHANARPHDVALFQLSTHGMRGCVPAPGAGALPWLIAGDAGPADEPNEVAGDEVDNDPTFDCPSPGAPGPRDGWFQTGSGGWAGVGAPRRDDELGAVLPGFAEGVGVIGVFDQCFAGEQADGSSDTHATLSAAGTAHTLLMSVVRERTCPAPPPGAVSPFTASLIAGLQPAARPGCAGGVTRAADANGDCVTTGVELFAVSDCGGCVGPVLDNEGVWTSDPDPVGGIAEPVTLGGAASASPGGTGPSAGGLGAVAGGAAAAAVALAVAGGWYARRRWIRGIER